MKIERKKLNIGYSIDGHRISIPYYEIKGKKKEPSVYIQGGIHGGELTYFIFHELIKQLKKMKVKGSITLVPICNPYSWMQKIHYYTIGKFSFYNGRDFNRNFPGVKNGTSIERLAWYLTNLAKKSKFSIDLHTTSRSKPYLIISLKEKEYLKMAKAINMPYTLSLDLEELKRRGGGMCFTDSQIKKGKKSLGFECGSHDSFNYENIRLIIEGLINTLSYFEVIETRKKNKKKRTNYLITKLKKYSAPTSGFVEYLVDFEKAFKKGKVLYRLYPSHNVLEIKNIKAKEDGIVFRQANTNIVREGDLVLKIAPQKNIKKL